MSKKSKTHQHTVPACYLSSFGSCGNNGRQSTVYFWNIRDNSTGLQSINRFPVEKGFYDIEGNEEYKSVIEDFYSRIEGVFASSLRELIKGIEYDPATRESNTVLIDKMLKDSMSAQLALQFVRTRAFREHYSAIYGQLKAGFGSQVIPDYSETDFKRLHLLSLIEPEESNFLANVFDDRNWVFLINHTNTPFYTSDNPVVCIDHRKTNTVGFSLLSKETTFFFPLSPTVAIEIYHKSVAKTDLKYFDIYNPYFVNQYNGIIKNRATRFLISNKPFELEKKASENNEPSAKTDL